MTRHVFSPTRYHTTFGAHEAALVIRDGDTVVTTTVDAAGHDARDVQVTERGNPLTGPFWVEGAEPGDVLAVRLETLVPNRRHGYSSRMLAPGVVDPDYVPELELDGPLLAWDVDTESNVARTLGPFPSITGLSLSLAPMLGCIGVAPGRGQAISTATSGPHGGNMDYREIRTGATVYFPVFVAGALFFVGDGHAAQGAGEMTGTGIEISFDVAFSVRVMKERLIGWPRGETDDVIFTIGNGRPLDEAVQHATAEMMRWLRTDYHLDAIAASTLIGQCADYHLGNMYDPAFTMVCVLEKQLLRDLPYRQLVRETD